METILKIDSTLHAELTAEIQKELNAELSRLRSDQKMKDSGSGGMKVRCDSLVLGMIFYRCKYAHSVFACMFIYIAHIIVNLHITHPILSHLLSLTPLLHH